MKRLVRSLAVITGAALLVRLVARARRAQRIHAPRPHVPRRPLVGWCADCWQLREVHVHGGCSVCSSRAVHTLGNTETGRLALLESPGAGHALRESMRREAARGEVVH